MKPSTETTNLTGISCHQDEHNFHLFIFISMASTNTIFLCSHRFGAPIIFRNSICMCVYCVRFEPTIHRYEYSEKIDWLLPSLFVASSSRSVENETGIGYVIEYSNA